MQLNFITAIFNLVIAEDASELKSSWAIWGSSWFRFQMNAWKAALLEGKRSFNGSSPKVLRSLISSERSMFVDGSTNAIVVSNCRLIILECFILHTTCFHMSVGVISQRWSINTDGQKKQNRNRNTNSHESMSQCAMNPDSLSTGQIGTS